MFSKVVIILVVLKVGASTSPGSDRIEDLREALRDSDSTADVEWANEIDDAYISCLYNIEEASDLQGEWNGWKPSPQYRTTALNLALIYGQGNVAMILLDRGADIFAVDDYGNTPLHFAVEHGLVNVVSKIMNIMGDTKIMNKIGMSKQQVIDRKNKAGKAPLHMAVFYMCRAVFKQLLDEGANPMITDDYGNTALHFATKQDWCTPQDIIDIIKVSKPQANQHLCQNGVTQPLGASLITQLSVDGLNGGVISVKSTGTSEIINLKGGMGRTALAVAVIFNRVVIAQTLLENGADPTIPDDEKWIPFRWAMQDKLRFANISPDFQTTSETILTLSQSILTMIQNIDVNHQYSDGSTLLHCAVKSRRNAIVKGVLDRDADPTIADIDGNTALHLAIEMALSRDIIIDIINAARPKTEDIVVQNEMTDPSNGELVPDGLDERAIRQATLDIINFSNHKGETAFFLAIRFKRFDIAQFLFENGADPSILINDLSTPFLTDIPSDLSDELILLIIENCDISHVNSDGNTILHMALKSNRLAVNRIVTKLLNQGADPLFADKNGNTALHLAISHDLFLSTIFHIIEAGGMRSLRQDEIMEQYGGFGASSIRLIMKIHKSFHPSCHKIVNIQNHNGETALHLAVSNTQVWRVQYLLEKGASRTIVANGQTALEVAMQMKEVSDSSDVAKIVEFLQQ